MSIIRCEKQIKQFQNKRNEKAITNCNGFYC
jgi:hypothetical protein